MFDLKQWAAVNKVSNNQIHRMSGISESTIASVMRGCSCTERTLKRICRGIGRPYDPAEWKNPVKASLKPVPVVDYDRVRNYRDRRSMEALRRNLTIGETVQVAFEGKHKIRWAAGEIVRIYDTHVGVMVQLKTTHGNALSLRKSYMIDDVVKWKTNLEV
ncbi:hypothetical protein DW091_06095 [Eubacterium sp. AM05-23]|uniref:hypothetical protein n=1 Tax=Eubacterium TaxID=1730 RepID=UPI000E4C0837|nr:MULTISPECIES: hypothetical protein [Eubacterium]RHO59311.1 hypothetical protein DW091_06095 [Eubacterium sp. AM05-23]